MVQLYQMPEDRQPKKGNRFGGIPVDGAAKRGGRFGGIPVESAPEPRGGQIARQAGLTARDVVTGLTGLPTLVGDAANAAVNLPIIGYNKLTGSDVPRLRYPSEVVQSGMTGIGLPQHNTPLERIRGAAIGAMTGAGVARAAQALASLPGTAGTVLREFANAPGLQVAGALGGATAIEGAREMGAGPAMMAGAGIVGGAVPGGAATIGARTASGALQAVKPFTTRGKEQLVGEALNRLSTTPAATIERLENARELVPGSRPMVPDVARDPGLIGADSAIRGMDENALIAQRKSEQNAARIAELNRLARDGEILREAVRKRDLTFDQIARPAFDNATPIQIGRRWVDNPVIRRIQSIRETPAGARQTVREAMDELQAMITQDGVDITNAQSLYELRKDMALLRDGKLKGAGKSSAELSNLRAAKREISDVISAVDDVLDAAAPGYRSYMQMYAKRSIPVDQLKALQDLRERAVVAAPDPLSQDDVLSQANFRRLLQNNVVENPNYSGRGPGAATMAGSYRRPNGTKEKVLARMSPAQLRALDRIAADLDRGMAASAGTMRTAGSDTFKNMSVAAVIGRVLGDKTGEAVMQSSAGKSIAAPISFLYRVPERDVQLLMLEAWRDPQLAARLMRQATRAEVENVGRQLAERAARQAAAAAVYGTE